MLRKPEEKPKVFLLLLRDLLVWIGLSEETANVIIRRSIFVSLTIISIAGLVLFFIQFEKIKTNFRTLFPKKAIISYESKRSHFDRRENVNLLFKVCEPDGSLVNCDEKEISLLIDKDIKIPPCVKFSNGRLNFSSIVKETCFLDYSNHLATLQLKAKYYEPVEFSKEFWVYFYDPFDEYSWKNWRCESKNENELRRMLTGKMVLKPAKQELPTMYWLKEKFQIKSKIWLKLRPLSKERTNFIIQYGEHYAIIIGDGDNQKIAIKENILGTADMQKWDYMKLRRSESAAVKKDPFYLNDRMNVIGDYHIIIELRYKEIGIEKEKGYMSLINGIVISIIFPEPKTQIVEKIDVFPENRCNSYDKINVGIGVYPGTKGVIVDDFRIANFRDWKLEPLSRESLDSDRAESMDLGEVSP